MPLVQGTDVTSPTTEFANWGLANFTTGMKNITKLHYHDCDEFVFMIAGIMVMRSEGIVYTLRKGDVLVTRMGDEHEILEIIEDTTYFWLETELCGKKRTGHLHRGEDD
jgi:mannose-6-phosphate isomerase-like protein (cupin superfamily)